MILIYLCIVAVIMVLFIATKKYKKNIRDRLSKEEHKLLKMYGVAMFIADKLEGKLGKARKVKSSNKFRALYISENIEEKRYWHNVKKISLCILVVLLFSLLGFIVSASEITKGSEKVSVLERASPGEGSTDISINAKGEESEEVALNINLSEEKMTEEEIYEMFDNSYDEVVKEMLDTNEDANNVSKPLNFIDRYNLIDISFEIPEETRELISYTGEITADFSKSDSYVCYVEAHFEYDDVENIYQIPLCLSKVNLTYEEELNQSVQNYLDTEGDEYSKEVNLPKEIDGKGLVFTNIASSDGKYYIVLAIIAAVLVALMYEKNLDKKVKERNDQLLRDYPDVVSKLALLNEAGLNLLSAWRRIITDSEKNNLQDRFVYKEMKLTYNRIKNGEAEGKEYVNFGKRCNLHPYIKLGNLLEQNLLKGNRGLAETLRMEAMDAFRERKRSVRKRGEEASTKLIFPMILNLGIIVVIIIVPAFSSMNF